MFEGKETDEAQERHLAEMEALDRFTKSQVREIIAAAEKWLSGLDRSVLGSFAMDAELLMLHYADDIAASNVEYRKNYSRLLNKINEVKGARKKVLASHDWLNAHLTAEVYYWQYVSGEFSIESQLNSASPGIKDRFYFLKMVAGIASDVPESIPYINAGFIDKEVIERFIADDVDPELAVEVSGSSMLTVGA